MKFVDTIIDELREDTENQEFNAVIGLSEEVFLRFINEAINRLHGKIVSQQKSIFSTEKEITCVANTQSYDVPRNAFNNNMIEMVEHSSTSQAVDYKVLKPTLGRFRNPSLTGTPAFYIRKGAKILLVPTPDQASTIRVTYVRKPIRLDKRRALIQAVTTSGSTITNLEIDWVNGETVDQAEILKRTKFCVVDKYGTILMDNVLLSSISTSATYDATFDVDATFAFESGETIPVGAYIVSGEYTTTHLLDTDFDNALEDYIRQYCVLRIQQRDSSVDQAEALAVLGEMEAQIVNNFKDLNHDVYTIPVSIDDNWD